MDVLVIGYGKIGGIKARIWRSLGRRVIVYDVEARKLDQALSDGFETFNSAYTLKTDLIVDISTPATFHLESLKWVLDTLPSLPRVILIEKPLASNPEELLALEALFSDESMAVKQRIIVNESYYLSSALKHLADLLREEKQNIQAISIELSKNRLEDVSAGRFTDPHLGALGIELPHMIALLQGLGIDLENLTVEKASIFKVQDNEHNEGFKLELRHKGTAIVLESYLGNFRIGEHDLSTSNYEVIRCLEAATDQAIYKVEFDPVQGVERYKSRVSILDSYGKTRKTIVLHDDHLTSHLKNLHLDEQHELGEYFTARNALAISKFIFALKNQADHHLIAHKPERERSALKGANVQS